MATHPNRFIEKQTSLIGNITFLALARFDYRIPVSLRSDRFFLKHVFFAKQKTMSGYVLFL